MGGVESRRLCLIDDRVNYKFNVVDCGLHIYIYTYINIHNIPNRYMHRHVDRWIDRNIDS